MQRDRPLIIAQGDYNHWERKQNTIFLLDRNLESFVSYLDEAKKQGFFFPFPQFLTLGHELIHALHDQLFSEEYCEHELQTKCGEPYDTFAEKLVITGECVDNNSKYFSLDIHEWALCSDFELPRRHNHRPGAPDYQVHSNEESASYAAMSGAFLNLKEYVKTGGDVNATVKGSPLLHYAASGYGHPDIISYLLKKGANTSTVDSFGMTALHHAVSVNKKRVCQKLILANADVNCYKYDKETVLEAAIKANRVKNITVLLDNGAYFDSSMVSLANPVRVLEIFLQRGLFSKEVIQHMLGQCILLGIEDKARLILRHGGDPNGIHLSIPLLHWSILLNHKPMVQLLLKHGANPLLADSKGKTALELAETKDPEILSLLKAH